MNQPMKYPLALIMAFSAVYASGQTPMVVSDTKYDWSTLANSIAQDKSSKYDQAYSIYRWLCDNISYDTSYTIHDADNAIEQNKGVCQAYCELFYRIGEALGLEVDIVGGKSKDLDGNISPDGHAWLFVHTDDDTGILIDPTWGAGSVDGDKFIPKQGDDSWFHIDPNWAIFTHFPDDDAYQLLNPPVDYTTFTTLPSYRPVLRYFHFDGGELLRQALSGESPDLPECFHNNAIGIVDVPKEGTLRIGREYKFELSNDSGHEFCLINGNDFEKEWYNSGDRYCCNFVPSRVDNLKLSYRPKGSQGGWTTVMEYKVAQPSTDDMATLDATAPHKSPVLKSLPNYYPEILRSRGIDFASLLAEVKRDNIQQLPTIATNGDFLLNSVPMNGVLKAGEKYTFKISPYEPGDWYIINGSEWLDSWTQDPESCVWEMSVTAAPQGKLRLAHRPEGSISNSCNIYLEYNIQL